MLGRRFTRAVSRLTVVTVVVINVIIVVGGGVGLEIILSIASLRDSSALDGDRSSVSRHPLLRILSNGWQGLCGTISIGSACCHLTDDQRGMTVSMIGLLHRFCDHDLSRSHNATRYCCGGSLGSHRGRALVPRIDTAQ